MIIIISPLDIKDLSFRLSQFLCLSLSLTHSFPLPLCLAVPVFHPLPLFRGLYALSLPSWLSVSLDDSLLRSLTLSPRASIFPLPLSLRAARVALGFWEMTIYKLLPGSLIQNASVDTQLVHYVKLIHRLLAIDTLCTWENVNDGYFPQNARYEVNPTEDTFLTDTLQK